MVNNVQLPIVICCSPRVHTFIGQDMMVSSVALCIAFLLGLFEVPGRFREKVTCFFLGNGVGFTQLALFGGGMYFELLVYIPEASTLGVSEVEGPLLVLPVTWAFSLVFSAV
ncbi:hypothetical protein Tco_0122048 [Tanacetum coccineum]